MAAEFAEALRCAEGAEDDAAALSLRQLRATLEPKLAGSGGAFLWYAKSMGLGTRRMTCELRKCLGSHIMYMASVCCGLF